MYLLDQIRKNRFRLYLAAAFFLTCLWQNDGTSCLLILILSSIQCLDIQKKTATRQGSYKKIGLIGLNSTSLIFAWVYFSSIFSLASKTIAQNDDFFLQEAAINIHVFIFLHLLLKEKSRFMHDIRRRKYHSIDETCSSVFHFLSESLAYCTLFFYYIYVSHIASFSFNCIPACTILIFLSSRQNHALLYQCMMWLKKILMTSMQRIKKKSSREHFLQKTLESVPSLISYVDSELRYVYATPQYTEWLHVPHESLIGKYIKDVIGETAFIDIKPHIEQALLGEKQIFYSTIPYLTGTKLVQCNYIPDKDEAGKVKGVFIILHDYSAIETKQKEPQVKSNVLEKILHNMPLGVIIRDLENDCRILYYNDAAEKITKKSSLETLEKKIEDILDPLFSSIILSADKKAIHEEITAMNEHNGIRIRTNLISKNDIGAYKYLVTILDDTKEAKEKEKNRFEKLFQSMLEGVYLINKHGIVTLCNTSCLRMIGYTEKEFIGKNAHDLIHNKHSDGSQFLSNECPIYRALHEQTMVVNIKDNFIRKDGSTFAVRYMCVPIDDDKNNKSIIVTFEDITIHNELEKEIEEQKIRMISAARLASLGEMSAGIAHEINNPLAIIDGSIHIIEKNKNPEKIKEKIEVIKLSIQRIASIVFGLKKFSRSSTKHFRTSECIEKIIQDAISTTSSYAQKNSVFIEKGPMSQIKTWCDPNELEQVFMHLIQNGIDASAESENEKKYVRITTKIENGDIYITITDNGSGISKDIEDKIFSPFFTTKEVGKGTGLGLAISKSIINAHHGLLTFSKNKDNETCFTVRLKAFNKDES